MTPQATARQHGERRTYNAGCRCEDCREANRIYVRGRYLLGYPNGSRKRKHGTRTMYNAGCRCALCKAANTRAARARRATLAARRAEA